MRFNRHSLFFKIFMGLWGTIMIFALTPLVFLLLSSKDHREMFYNQAKKELDKEVVISLRKSTETGDVKAILKSVRRAEKRLNVKVYVFDEQNREIFGRQYPANASQLIQEMQDGKVVLIKKYTEDPADSRVIRVLKSGGFTLVGYPADGDKPTYARMIVTQHIHILLYIFVLSLIASLILVRYFTRPLTTLSRAAGQIAEGDFSVRVSDKLKRKDEIGLLAVDFDMMADRLQTHMKNQENMLRNISHELRSPLTRLRLSLELARAKAGENAAPALDRIETESERLNEMIGFLIEIARIKASTEMQEKVCVSDIIEEAKSNWLFEATENGRVIDFKITGGCCIRGNSERLKSGLENIVRNAIRYSKKLVEIEVSSDSGYIKILVSDDGNGVEEKHLHNIFSPFYRVHDDRDRKTGGTGLGLAIAKTAADVHNGSIRAYNNSKGGLTIEILLPEM